MTRIESQVVFYIVDYFWETEFSGTTAFELVLCEGQVLEVFVVAVYTWGWMGGAEWSIVWLVRIVLRDPISVFVLVSFNS